MGEKRAWRLGHGVPAAERRQMYLIHDEVEAVLSKGSRRHEFRVRIWCEKNSTPVVLVSQVKGGTPPGLMPNRIANQIARLVPGYGDRGLIYFDATIEQGEWVLRMQHHDMTHDGDRVKLCGALAKRCPWETLERHVGEPIWRS